MKITGHYIQRKIHAIVIQSLFSDYIHQKYLLISIFRNELTFFFSFFPFIYTKQRLKIYSTGGGCPFLHVNPEGRKVKHLTLLGHLVSGNFGKWKVVLAYAIAKAWGIGCEKLETELILIFNNTNSWGITISEMCPDAWQAPNDKILQWRKETSWKDVIFLHVLVTPEDIIWFDTKDGADPSISGCSSARYRSLRRITMSEKRNKCHQNDLLSILMSKLQYKTATSLPAIRSWECKCFLEW